MSTTENIIINIREDGSRVVVVNINAIANASASASTSVAGLSRALGGLSALALAKKFFEMADAVTLLDARLRLATKGAEQFAQAQQDIYKISQDANVGLRETTRLYTKMADPIRNLGGGLKEVAGIVDAFATGLRISGANTQEAAAATLQFAQAMNKGKLDGDEFRTMAEVAPRVMRAMADGMAVPVGALKQMASQGKLTADVIGNALLSQLKTLKEEAQGLGNTVGGAFSDLSNDSLIAVGAFDKMTGASAGLADIIQGLSLIVFELAQVFRDEIKDGTSQADRSFETTGFVIKGLGTVLETLLVLGSDVSHIFKTIGGNLGGFAAQVVALLRGDLGAVSNIQDSLVADNENRLKELERYQGRIIGMTDRALAARDKLKNAKPGDVDTDFSTLKAVASETDLIKVRMRLTGVTQTYFNDMNFLEKALKENQITTKEYVSLMGELATKTYAASAAGRAAAKATRGSDDRLKNMQHDLLGQQMVMDSEESIFSKRDEMLSFYHDRMGLSDSDFYQGREAARREFLAAEEESYKKERAIVESFKPKNAREVADQKLKLDTLLRNHVKFYDELSSMRTKDTLNQTANQNDVVKKSNDSMNEYLTSQYEALQGLKIANGEREKSAAVVERESVAMLELALANMQANAAAEVAGDRTQADIDAAGQMVNFLTTELDIRRGISEELEKQQKMKRDDKNALQAIRDWKDAGKDIAESLKTTFGSVGDALGDVFKAYANSVADQLDVTYDLAKAIKGLKPEDPERIKAEAKARQDIARIQIKSYSDMISGAKGFFKENSKGYKTMEIAEKGFRALELALAIKSMVTKSGLLEAFTGLFVTSKALETKATVASVAPDVAASMTKGTAAAAVGVAQQAQGDPYTAWARMAAMAAMMAALGFAVSGNGSGGGMTAAEVQKKQGTGTVFGDSSAKSNSVANSLEIIKDNSNGMVPLNQGMLKALRNIESSMTGLANILFRSPGVVEGTNLGIIEGQINKGQATDRFSNHMTGLTKAVFATLPGVGGKIASFINNLWGKTKQNIVDSGIDIKGTIDQLQAGKGFEQYASVDVTKSSLFGLIKKKDNYRMTGALNEESTNQLAQVFVDVENLLKEAAIGLGGRASDIDKALEGLTINASVSLKGLTGDALATELNSIISKAVDEMASTAFPEFEKFRKSGEGFAETVVRLVNNYAQIDASLAQMNMVFKAVGIGSVAAREDLLKLSGGLDEFVAKTSFFTENFLTEAERMVPVQKYVNEEFAKLNIALPATREGFKELVLAQDLTTEKGRENFTTLMDVAQAFATLTPALKETGRTAQSIADERTELQGRLDNATLDTMALMKKQKDLIHDSNKDLYDQVIVAEKAKEVATERKSIQDQIDNALMSSTDLLTKQRNALDEANRGLFDFLQGVLAVKQNLTTSMTGLTKAVTAQKAIDKDVLDEKIATIQAAKLLAKEELADSINQAKDRVSMQEAANSSLHKLSDALKTAIGNTSGPDSVTAGASRRVAQQGLDQALFLAKLTGVLPDGEALAETLKGLSQDTKGMFGSLQEERTDRYKTAGKLAELNAMTDVQMSVSDMQLEATRRQLTALEGMGSSIDSGFDKQITAAQEEFDLQMKKYDEIISNAQQQIEIANGTYVATLSITNALVNFNDSLNAVLALKQAPGNYSSTSQIGEDGLVYVTESRSSADNEGVANLADSVDLMRIEMVKLLEDIATSNNNTAAASVKTADTLTDASKGGRPIAMKQVS